MTKSNIGTIKLPTIRTDNERVNRVYRDGGMDAPMACNLLRAGYPVTVHTRTKAKAQPVLDAGAQWAASPAQAAAKADVVIACVTDTPDVQAVLLGTRGVIESARPGMTCIGMSTVSPDAARLMVPT